MEKSGQWSVELHLVGQKSMGSLILNYFYSLEELILMAKNYEKPGRIKLKFVPTWIIEDIQLLLATYLEHGYVIEKFTIKRQK